MNSLISNTEHMNRMTLLKDDIYSITGLSYFNSNELITLCPKCEKERFNLNRKHGHLYISLENPIFKCFRCPFKGIITKLLNEFNLNIDKYYTNDVFNLNWKNKDKDYFLNSDIQDTINLPDVIDTNINYEKKLKYITSRIPNLKHDNIIFNIQEFIQSNNIDINKDDDFIKYLNENFIGFLTTRKSKLVCRNIDSNSSFRYFNITLKNIYFKDFYSKLLNIETYTNKIVLCEGIFDLYNIIEHEKTKPIIQNASIIATSLNNDYKNTLISVLDYVKILHSDVIIFSDKDVKEENYMNIYFNNCVKSLTLYYNEYEKDFGTTNIHPIKVPITKYIKRKQYV